MRELRTFRPNPSLVPRRIDTLVNYNIIEQAPEEPINTTCRETEEPNNAPSKKIIKTTVPNMYHQAEIHEEPTYATIKKRHQRYKSQRLKNGNKKVETPILKIPLEDHRVNMDVPLDDTDDTKYKEDLLKEEKNPNVKIDKKKMTRRRACWFLFLITLTAATISTVCILQSPQVSPVQEVKNVTPQPAATELPPELRQLLEGGRLWSVQTDSTQQPEQQSAPPQDRPAVSTVHTELRLQEQLEAAHIELTLPDRDDTVRDRGLQDDTGSDNEEKEEKERKEIDSEKEEKKRKIKNSEKEEKEKEKDSEKEEKEEKENNKGDKIVPTEDPLITFSW